MTELIEFLKTFDKTSPKSILTTFNYITRHAQEPNLVTIIPFLLNLKDQKLSFPNHYIRSANYAVKALLEKINSIDYKYKALVEQIKINIETKQEEKRAVVDLKQSIIDTILPLLLRVSYKEFENVIYSYYNKKEIIYSIENDLIELNKLTSKKSILKSYYSLISTLRKDEIDSVIKYFIKSKTDATGFFIVLYLTNKPLYDLFCEMIFDNYGSNNYIIKSLPEITCTTVSDAIIKYFVQNRPVQLNNVISMLADNRNYLINLVKDHYETFDISSLNLTFDEELVISKSNDAHALKLLQSVVDDDFDAEKQKLIIEFLLQKEPAFLNQFIDNLTDSKSYETIILQLVKQKRLPEEVQKKLETKFIDNSDRYSSEFVRKLFFSIIFYLDTEKIIKNLETYLKSEDDLRELLRVLSPVDIMYNIHYFKDIENSLLASTLITPKKEIFNDQICMCVIQKMEENVLPPIFMRTVMLSLINFPTLKKFVIDLCYRLIKYEIWSMPRLYNGYIKCLSFLGSSCAEIIMAMPEERMKEVFSRNEKILSICENWVKNDSNIKGRYAFLFKNAIYCQISKTRNK